MTSVNKQNRVISGSSGTGSPVTLNQLAQQNQRLTEAVHTLLNDSAELRRCYGDLLDTLQCVLADQNDNHALTWSPKIIAEKTSIPIRIIRQAMRTGQLASIIVHKRGRGCVRVTSPENVKAWLESKHRNNEKPPARLPAQQPRRKPPNVVF